MRRGGGGGRGAHNLREPHTLSRHPADRTEDARIAEGALGAQPVSTFSKQREAGNLTYGG
jgi:hypothetical protein